MISKDGQGVVVKPRSVRELYSSGLHARCLLADLSVFRIGKLGV
jgi:hypothetical protein